MDLSSLPLDQLKTFVTFVEAGSAVAAARQLGVSQPAVSAQLARLETSLPFALFAAGGQKKTLSPSGDLLYQAIKTEMTALTAALERLTLLHASPDELELRLAARREIVARLAGRMRFPGRIRFLLMPGEEALTALLSHTCDAAVLSRVPDGPQLTSQPLFRDGVRFAVHKSLLRRRTLTAELIKDAGFLRELPCIAYKERPPFLGELAEAAGLSLRELNVRRICEDWELVAAMVAAGQGYSVIPADIVLPAGVTAVDVPPRIVPETVFHLVYRSAYADVPAVKSLAQALGT